MAKKASKRAKSNKNNLSRSIIFIGRLTVAIGIIVALVTISTGLGTQKAIKNKLADFNGHIVITNYDNNNSLENTVISTKQDFYLVYKQNEHIKHIQVFANISGVIRTEKNFNGVVFKGVGNDFDKKRFDKFLVKGEFPNYSEKEYSNEVVLSNKIVKELELAIDSSFVMYFIRDNNKKTIYRKFIVKGIFETDIKDLDGLYMLGDIKHIQRINKWSEDEVGGFELFVDEIENLESISEDVYDGIGYEFYTLSALDKFVQISEWIKIFDTNIKVILSLMLIVIVVNMTMVLLILIIERINTIGLLKSIGASNWQIRYIFILYALFIMIPGLLIGNFIGIGLLLIQKYFNVIELNPESYFVNAVPVYLNWQYILLISISSLIISGITLLLPSYLISRISPIKALKLK